MKASRNENRADRLTQPLFSVANPRFFSRFKAETEKSALITSDSAGRHVTIMLSDSRFVFSVSRKNGVLTLSKGGTRRKKESFIELPDIFFHKLMSGAVQPMILFNRREWPGDDDPESASWFFLILPVLGAAFRRAAESARENDV